MMTEMTDGNSPSVLDDLVGAFKSVFKTILSVFLLALAIVVGVFLIAALAVIGSILWLGHKVRLIKEPPRVKFQRFQAALMGKFIQWRLKKSGLGGMPGFGQGGPFGQGGAAGPFGQGGPFGQAGPGGGNGNAAANPFAGLFNGARPDDAPDQESIAEAYRQATESAKGRGSAQTVQSAPKMDDGEIHEVDAEPVQTDMENFHGSLDEYMRLKGKR